MPSGQSGRVQTSISRWGEHGQRPRPASVNESRFAEFGASASVEVACSPVAAWQLVTDIPRIGAFSPECVAATWMNGAAGPAEGARFEGTNRVVDEATDNEFVWVRPCMVTVAKPPERFSYTVGDRYDGTPATLWDFQIEATDTGCRITQRFQHLPQGLSGIRLQADADPTRAEAIIEERTRALAAGMDETLRRMKYMLEAN